jgi:hypothetical protein
MYPPTRGTCHSHFPESPLSCERVLGRCFGAGFFRVIRTGCLRTTAPITARPPAVARAPRVVGFPGVSVLTTWLPVSSTSAAAAAPRAPDFRRVRRGAGDSSISASAIGGDGTGSTNDWRASTAVSPRDSPERPADNACDRPPERTAPAGEFDFGVKTTRCGGVAAAGDSGTSVTTLVGRCCRLADDPMAARGRRARPCGVATGVLDSKSANGLPTPTGDASGGGTTPPSLRRTGV